MKKSFFLCACTAIALCFASCLRDELQKPDSNSTGFGVMIGGSIDPAQSFNLAGTQSVTVSVETESLVRVYTNGGFGRTVMVAEKTVKGTQTISFDAVPGAQTVTLLNKQNNQFATVKAGGKVDFTSASQTATRAVYPGNTTVTAQALDEYNQFDYGVVSEDVYTDAFYSLESASPLFYSKTGSFTLYPCWYTSESGQSASLGIYYYNNDQIVEVPIFNNDKDDDWYQLFSVNDGGQYRSYTDAHMSSLANYGDFDKVHYRSKGIQVTVPANTAFGFYVIGNDQAGKYYSEELRYSFADAWTLNSLDMWLKWGNDSYINGQKEYFGHVAYIDVDGRKYLGCDDGCEVITGRGVSTPQYYHMVFSISGDLSDRLIADPETNPETEPESPNAGKFTNDTLSWILACEDLGENADYDFNDIVLKITHVSGSTNADVTLMAAGGTLKSNVWFGDTDLGEVHELFEVDDTIMVNTWQQLTGRPQVHKTITVPEDFTMSSENMGGFMIRRGDITGIVAAPEQGSVPYMICVPGDWKWPREMTRITDAYPSFAGWCTDHTTNLDWYKNAVESKVFSK